MNAPDRNLYARAAYGAVADLLEQTAVALRLGQLDQAGEALDFARDLVAMLRVERQKPIRLVVLLGSERGGGDGAPP